jgi:hypothetical protein
LAHHLNSAAVGTKQTSGKFECQGFASSRLTEQDQGLAQLRGKREIFQNRALLKTEPDVGKLDDGIAL